MQWSRSSSSTNLIRHLAYSPSVLFCDFCGFRCCDFSENIQMKFIKFHFLLHYKSIRPILRIIAHMLKHMKQQNMFWILQKCFLVFYKVFKNAFAYDKRKNLAKCHTFRNTCFKRNTSFHSSNESHNERMKVERHRHTHTQKLFLSGEKKKIILIFLRKFFSFYLGL